jgi:monoamine oxidase
MKTINRKEFLRLSSVVATGAILLPNLVFGKMKSGNESTDYDVVIIGAGLAGLSAALRLEQAGVSSILILEAKNMLGGRTLNIPVAGGYLAEGGGQWIGPGQTAIYNLMLELSISSFPAYQTGNDVNATTLSAAEQADYDNALLQLNNLAATVPLADPWNASNAAAWDNITLEDWMNINMTSFDGYIELYGNVSGFLSAEPSSISLLYFLFYVNSAGSLEALLDDAQQERISGGAQRLSLALAANINATISLNSPVSALNDLGNEVEVRYNSTTVSTKKVVVAMMPKDAANISFPSGLSATRQNLQNSWVAANGVKVSIVYDTPFWRTAGFSGTAYGTIFSFMVDNSPNDASSGILTGFPSDNFLLQPIGNREQLAKDEIESFFGLAAQSNIDYVETDWSTETTIGGCVSPIPEGVLTSYGSALRVPEGNIHWAGTETSEIWTGYMDGAIRSGERVAQEIAPLVLGITSLEDEPAINVFPNPCTEYVNVQITQGDWTLNVRALDGRLAKETLLVSSGLTRINMMDQPSGTYILTFENGQKVISSKIIKRRK